MIPQIMKAHLQGELPVIRDEHPEMPAGLETVVRRATRRRLVERYPDANSLLHDLRRLDHPDLSCPDLRAQPSMGEPSLEGLASLARFAAAVAVGFIGLVVVAVGMTVLLR
jgi:hypothetical protein